MDRQARSNFQNLLQISINHKTEETTNVSVHFQGRPMMENRGHESPHKMVTVSPQTSTTTAIENKYL